jgi:hypothetical protein
MADATLTMEAPLSKKGGRITVTVEGEEVIKDSPEHLALSQEFDLGKRYMFELASKNPERIYPVINMRTKRPAILPEYKPFQNLVYTSQIIWNGRRRMIRYYDGCDTIFVDKQPKDSELIKQLISQTRRRNFTDGYIGFTGDERMLLLYLYICSWNGNSLFRTRTASTVFVPVDSDIKIANEAERLDAIEEALALAKNATAQKMFIHGEYLGISREDQNSGNELTEKEFRIKYRKAAQENPNKFIESYGNRSIEIQYFIDKALERGIISNKLNPNKATWGTNNAEICDISGLRSQEAISQKLFEFSQTEEGAEFLVQLKALSESL